MTSYKKLIKGTTINLALRSVGVLTNFLLIVMISRRFGPAGLAVFDGRLNDQGQGKMGNIIFDALTHPN